MPHSGTESLPCSDPANILASVLPSPSTDCSVQANSIMPWRPNYFMIFPLLSLTVNFWMCISSRIQALLPLSKTYSCQVYHLFLAPQAQMLFPFVRHPHCYYWHYFFQRKINVYIYQTFLKIHRKVKNKTTHSSHHSSTTTMNILDHSFQPFFNPWKPIYRSHCLH